jgi:hypothetical protein
VKAKFLALGLLAAGAAFAQLSIGVRIGAPPPLRVMRVQPRSPGADYTWIGGYWYPVGNHYKWHDGYWTRPAFNGAHWVQPRHDGQRYFDGYWQADERQVAHDHRWDRGRDHKRDFDRDHDRRR